MTEASGFGGGGQKMSSWWKKALGTVVSVAAPVVCEAVFPFGGAIVGGALGSMADDLIESGHVNMEDVALGGAMGFLGGGAGRAGARALNGFKNGGLKDAFAALKGLRPRGPKAMWAALKSDWFKMPAKAGYRSRGVGAGLLDGYLSAQRQFPDAQPPQLPIRLAGSANRTAISGPSDTIAPSGVVLATATPA